MPKRPIVLVLSALLLALPVSAQIPRPTPAGDPVDALRPDSAPGSGTPPLVEPSIAAQRERERAALRAQTAARARSYLASAGGAMTGMQSLLAAGTAATQPSIAYLTYSETAETTCAAAPWECARYAWDAVSGVYIDNRGLSSAPFGAAPLGALPSAALPAPGSSSPSAEAYQALTLFAATEQLMIAIEPLYAGSFSADVSRVLGYLPPEVRAYIAALSEGAEAAYWGLWQGGAGGVFFAECSPPATCVIDNAFNIGTADNEAGVYTLFVPEMMPASPEAALALLTRVYPALMGMGFTQLSDISAGYAFTSRYVTIVSDGSGGQMAASTVTYLTGVMQIAGRTLTYAIAAGAAFPLQVTG
jgi:hypothetical protein